MRRLLLALVLCSSAPAVFAAGWDADFSVVCRNRLTCQQDFRSVTKDITAALNYKPLGPAEAGGLTGIGVGAIASYAPADSDAWKNVTGADVDAVGMVGVVARKGLPLNLDVGAFYAGVPGSGVSVYGGEVRWAILPGGVAEPALAVRGSFTKTSGIDDFDYDAYGLDVSLSKGFALLTPYVGFGYVWAKADPHGNFGLQEEKVDATKLFAGLRLGLALLDITPEYERTGDRDSYNLLLGLSF